ncbi:hypothetical protein [Streptomyces sp. NPDC005283]|uniref:hypothetical protein n=1 Tax=Streptomyces sp. NPDC005283 TaxID=3156871 RepID=UPI003452A9E2
MTVSFQFLPSRLSFWLTLVEYVPPVGDSASFLASVMYGAGITITGVFGSSPNSATEPSLRAFGVRPPVFSVKVYDTGPAGAASRTMFSLTCPRPTLYCRSAPPTASLYVTVSPLACGFSDLPAPFRPIVTERPPGTPKRSSFSASEPNQLWPVFAVLAKSKPFAVVGLSAVSIGFQDFPDLYETGTAASSASTRPSDICQNRA